METVPNEMRVAPGSPNYLRVSLSAKPWPAGNDDRSAWNVSVSVNGTIVSEDIHLCDPLDPHEKKECAWYLQQYAQQSPFSATRARSAEGLLAAYPKTLLRQLGLEKILGPFIQHCRKKLLWIDISEQESSLDRTVHQLYWELLEESSSWTVENINALIRRIEVPVTAGDVSYGYRSCADEVLPPAAKCSFNILLVVARDLSGNTSAYEDISPSVASSVLLNMRQQLAGKNLHIKLDIVRPGTLSALEEHLRRTKEAHGIGYYHIVHLDMHGAVKIRKKTKTKVALLYFNHSKFETLTPVNAEKVATLLERHQIRTAVLNACESARASDGDDANIAKIFAKHGIWNIVAMSFKISSHAAQAFLETFYRSLLLQGHEFSMAVANGRATLRTGPIRHARFRMDISVVDWFIPVAYCRNGDLESPDLFRECMKETDFPASGVCADSATCLPEDSYPCGREFDLLRLERVLSQHKHVYLHGPAGVGKSAFIEYACSLWRPTSFFDAIVIIDFANAYIHNVNSLRKAILRQLLQIPGNTWASRFWTIKTLEVESYDNELLESTIRDFLSTFRTLFVLENLHAACTILPEHLVPNYLDPDSEQDVLEFLDRIQKSDATRVGAADHNLILVDRRDNPTSLRRYFSQCVEVDLYSFKLRGLALADFMDFAQALLQQSGVVTSTWTHGDLDKLELLATLLDGIPSAMKELIQTAAFLNIKWPNLYDYIHRGEFRSRTDTPREARQQVLDALTIRTELFNMLAHLPDELSATLIALSNFWCKGPLPNSFQSENLQRILQLDKDHVNLALSVAVDRGFVNLGERFGISWIHPLLTVYCRGYSSWVVTACLAPQETGENPLGENTSMREYFVNRTQSLQAAILTNCTIYSGSTTESSEVPDTLGAPLLEWYSESLNALMYSEEMIAFAVGFDLEDLRPKYAPLLPNVLTAINLCRISNNYASWPWIALLRLSDELAIMGTTAELKICLERYEELVTRFLDDNGLAISPQYQAPILHLIQFIIRVQRQVEASTEELGSEKFVNLSEEILKASESTFGPFSGVNNLYEKGYIMRQRIIALVQRRQWQKALEQIESFLEIDATEYREYEKFLEEIAAGEDSNHQLTDSLVKVLSNGPEDARHMHDRISSCPGQDVIKAYHDTRRRIYEHSIQLARLAVEGREDASKELESALDGLSESYLTIKQSNEALGITGADKDTSSMPPGADMKSYYRRFENPLNRLQELELATESGAWIKAAEHHEALFRDALQECDFDEALLHTEQLIDIYSKEPLFTRRTGELIARKEYFASLRRYMTIMDNMTTDNRFISAIDARNSVDEMLRSMESVARDNETLQHGVQILRLARASWSMQAENPHQTMQLPPIEVQKAAQKELLKKLFRKPGNKDSMDEFIRLHIRTLQIHLEIQQCALSDEPDQFHRAFELQSELEELAKTEFGPYLIDVDALPLDRERLEFKQRWAGAILGWVDAIEKKDFGKAFAQLDISDQLRDHASVTPSLKNITLATTDNRRRTTEIYQRSRKVDASFESGEYSRCIEELDDLVKHFEASHISGSAMVGLVESAKLKGTMASWIERHQRGKSALLQGDHETAAQVLGDLIRDYEMGRFGDAGSMFRTLAEKEVKGDFLSAVLILDVKRKHFQECMQHCDEYAKLFATEIAANPRAYDWLTLQREDVEIAYHNNEYLKADYAFDYADALRHIGILASIMDHRTQTPNVDRAGSAVQITKEFVEAMKAQVLQKKSIMDALGPVNGRQFILAARAAMGYKPEFF
ncbi:hypothetical protein CC78DRAFT_585774 [Lojkania enalia]|uniref:CHAT domain-containing protein n=1 Tax=Lojkania enalia TaxID=147567 RepID=A0A9P4K2H5_9PLEO|nr:hypothetical protein CC78DRAFT_585774 [Didymosphaeria enalia]